MKGRRVGAPRADRVGFCKQMAALPVFVYQVYNFEFVGFHIRLRH